MNYKRFNVIKYKGICDSSLATDLSIIPIIGVNESGKSSFLEAIAHFDYRNDELANLRHWKVVNRCAPTSSEEYFIETEIVFNKEEFDSIIVSYSEEEKNRIIQIIPEGSNTFVLTRKFSQTGDAVNRNYLISDQTDEFIDRLSKDIIKQLPRILFIDDFFEHRFPDSITFPDDYTEETVLDEEHLIVRKMFSKAGLNLQEYFNITETWTKGTQLEKVNAFVTDKVIDDWNEMHLDRGNPEFKNLLNLKIALQPNQSNPRTIDFIIKESFEGDEAPVHFPISDRSKGFIWFFNFSLRQSFESSGEENFIYLIDEPGSFLHNSAQSQLLVVLKQLSAENLVIFSTHSEFLLDPEVINPANVKIFERKDKQIRLVSFGQASDNKKQGALSTIYNALNRRMPIDGFLDKKVIVTEGITNFYFWKMIIKDLLLFLPGHGAGENQYLLSIAIGASRKYCALFDGDIPGDTAIKRYIEFFGERESENWPQYIDKNRNKTCLEKLLSKEDQEKILLTTGASEIKKAIIILFFGKEETKSSFWVQINSDTKNNILQNLVIIKEKLNVSELALNYDFSVAPPESKIKAKKSENLSKEIPKITKEKTAIKISGGKGNKFINNKVSGFDRAFELDNTKDNEFFNNKAVNKK